MKRSVLGIAAAGLLAARCLRQRQVIAGWRHDHRRRRHHDGRGHHDGGGHDDGRRRHDDRRRRHHDQRVAAAAAATSRSPGSAAWAPARRPPATRSRSVASPPTCPGIDFTWITGMTKAYFDCVNDNGGINGRPIQYIAETEQVDPQQIAALATKLVEQDKVLGLVGNTSIIDCSVNKDYYAQAGLLPDHRRRRPGLLQSPNFSAVNMGPYYSSLGGAQAAVRAGAKGKLVIVVAQPARLRPDQQRRRRLRQAARHGGHQRILEDVPITDPAGLAQQLVQEAGDGGGVVLDFTGPDRRAAPAGHRAAGPRSTRWCGPAPRRRTTRRWPRRSSAAWNGKFLINAEFNVLDSGKPDQNHMNEIRAEVRAPTSRARASPRWATSPAGSPPTPCSASRATSPRRA